MGKETFYFSHDYNARNDPKMVNLQIKHSMSGVGIYWSIIEMLYEENGYLRKEYERIAYVLRCDVNSIISVIHDFDLFYENEDYFFSKSVIDRLNKRNEKSAKARESVEKRWNKYEKHTNVEKRNTNLEIRNTIKESKVKESKVNKSKVNIAENPQHTQTEIESFEKFKKWIFENAGSVGKMKEPFEISQFLEIRKKFTIEQITELILKMHNWQPLLTKNKNAYLTFLNWSKKDFNTNGFEEKKTIPPGKSQEELKTERILNEVR